jgi:N utilization substance protein A
MSELMLALEQIEKEKGISKDVIVEAIEKSLLDACKKDFGKSDNVTVNMDRETGAIEVYAAKTVVEQVEDDATEISLDKALMMSKKYAVGDTVNVEITPKNFGRIAAQQARSVIVQTIKEEEKKALYEHFYCKEKDVVTGVVQRYVGKNISVSLDDKMDALLMENEQIKGEHYRPTDRIKLYIVEVKETNKGPKVIVSRTHPELVKRLFEKEVTEVADGTVEIKSISREAGSRSKIAVWSNDPNVDPVGACVGMNGNRVNTIVDDLKGEKIDIITWSEDPAIFIENALSPSKVVSVDVDEEEKSARVVVPDYQLSLAIGKEGQNARLAARLTGYKIDIKSESQAREAYGYDYDDDYSDEYDEDGEYTDRYDEDGEYRDEYDENGQYDDYDDNGDGYEEDHEYSDEEYEESYKGDEE